MKHFPRSLGLIAALHYAVAVAQGAPPRQHDHSAPESKEVAAPSKGDEALFDSYRRFNPDEPLKDWRAANEEVRKAGGHIGLLKAAKPSEAAKKGASPSGHGVHGQGAKP